MKVIALCIQVSLLAASDAFNVQPGKRSDGRVSMSMTGDGNDGNLSRRAFSGTFGAVTLASIMLGDVEGSSAFTPTSLTVAEEVLKTLDFSLPSYDSISSSKASVSTVEGLTEDYKPEKDAPTVKSRKKAKEPKSSSGGNPLGSVLPSMNKGAAKKAKPKAAPASRPEPKEKEEKSVEVETMDLSLPSYSSDSGKEKSIFSI